MPTTCKIYFEKNSNIVHPGEKVCIVVRLKLTEEIKYRSITIQLRGKTHMCFLEDDHKREGSYLANDNVLDMKKCLEGEFIFCDTIKVMDILIAIVYLVKR